MDFNNKGSKSSTATSLLVLNQLGNDLKNHIKSIQSSQDDSIDEDENVSEIIFRLQSTEYKEVMNVIKAKYGIDKTLIHDTEVSRGPRIIALKCNVPNCIFRIVCHKRSVDGSYFRFLSEKSNLVHGIVNDNDKANVIGVCGGTKSSKAVNSYTIVFYTLIIY